MKSSLILLVSLLALLDRSVEAGIFLKVKDPSIVQGATWLYSNSTAITQVAQDVPANKFVENVAPLDNVPSPGSEGTTGVLYNRDDSCSSSPIQQPIPLPFYAADANSTKVPKIALIKKQGGSCSLNDKIMNAQNEGAIGAIIYDTLTNTDAQDRKMGVPKENGIKIPAYYVDHSVGVELYHQLEKMAGVPLATIPTYDGVNLTTRITVRLSLMPADNVKPVAWELTLLVMIVILGTSIVFSVAMHIYIWKKGQRLQTMVERQRAPRAEATPMGKALLTIARLMDFPTRTIDTLPDEEERKKVEDVLSDEKQREAILNTTKVTSAKAAPNKGRESMFRKKAAARNASVPSVVIKIDAPVNNMCVICLEAFKIGDEVRELPCHHEYHCVCIDPWLTSKSSECPLCKFDCSAESKEGAGAEGATNTEALNQPTGLRGLLLRPYYNFKSNRSKKMGQVGDISATQSGSAAQTMRQSVMTAPGSPGLRAALRAIESSEATSAQQQAAVATAVAAPIAVAAVAVSPPPIEEQQLAYAAATSGSDLNNFHSMDDLQRPLHPYDQVANEPLTRVSTDYRNRHGDEEDVEEEEDLPRLSVATQDYPPTITTSTSTYAPAADGSLLPDIDVSSISLCSIDLDNVITDSHI